MTTLSNWLIDVDVIRQFVMSRTKTPSLLASVVLLIVSVGCSTRPQHEAQRSLHYQRVAVTDGLKSPWAIAFVDRDHALITEKEGGITKVNLRSGETAPVGPLPTDLVDDIRSETRADNGGLFDIVLDPAFPDNQWIYLSYASKSTSGRTLKVVRTRLEGTALLDYQPVFAVFPYVDDQYFHYGGGLAFGTDGMLYITAGDRLFNERENPDTPYAQDPRDFRGKVFRVSPDGSIPTDNPDFGAGSASGLYAIGIRAAQGITLNAGTGELWFSEHGSRQGDEINQLRAGANYGWPSVTSGQYRNDDYDPPALNVTDTKLPRWSWSQTVAPTGLTFYYGDKYPQWSGDMFVAGLSRGSLWRLNFEHSEIISVEELFVKDRVRSRDIAVGPDGFLYQLTDTLIKTGPDGAFLFSDQPSGQLLRIEPK